MLFRSELRLARFFPGAPIVALDEWEFMGRLWTGEAIGFSEWLRPEERPEQLESLALDFSALPREGCIEILTTLGLSIRPGMTIDQIRAELGEPCDVHEFRTDGKDYDFKCGDGDDYLIWCTVRHDSGLSYLVVMCGAELS